MTQQTKLAMVSKTDPMVYVEQACRWVKKNPESFKKLMSIVHGEVDRGNPRVQRSLIYVYAEKSGIEIAEDAFDGITRDHNLWAVLARYMVMLRPRLARALHFKGAGCDDTDMIGAWRSTVNAGTVFLAKDWKEALELCRMKDVTAR